MTADLKDFTHPDWAPSLKMTTESNESSVKQLEENLKGHQRSGKHQEDKKLMTAASAMIDLIRDMSSEDVGVTAGWSFVYRRDLLRQKISEARASFFQKLELNASNY